MSVRGGYQPEGISTPKTPTTGSGVKQPPSDNVRWDCGAKQRHILPDGQDCDWPVCGCDPYASKVLDAIAESGFKIVRDTLDEDAQAAKTSVYETGTGETAARVETSSKDHGYRAPASPSQASEVALARWPDDTVIHASLRNAFIDGAVLFGQREANPR